jgi:hypothetical protein
VPLELPDADVFHDEVSMKRGLLTGLLAITLGGVGVLLTDPLGTSDTNAAPVMSVLADAPGSAGQAIAISGTCTDPDGRPNPPGAVAYLWSVDSDTGTTCVVAAPTSATTTVSSVTVGTCSLTLTCCDVAFSGSTCPAPGLDDSDTLVATISEDPFSVLLAAIGSRLVGMWRVPYAIDSTITVIDGRIQQLNSLVGGNPLVAASEANRPLLVTKISGLSGGACLHKDGSGRFLDAALSIPAGNRAGMYVVGRPAATSASTFVHATTIDGSDDSTLGVNASTGYLHKSAFTTGGEISVVNTPITYYRWDLMGDLPLASGALARLNRQTLATNWATTSTKRAVSTVRCAHSAASGFTYVKSIYIITDITLADEQAIWDYESAEGVQIGETLPLIVIEGQSNAAYLKIDGFPETDGYQAIKLGTSSAGIDRWNKTTGDLYAALLARLQQSAASGRRTPIVWVQGETDAVDATLAANYLAKLEQLRTDLEADLGLGSDYLYWVIWRFHNGFLSNPLRPYANVVNAALGTFIANHAAHATEVDPNDSGLPMEADLVHLGPMGGTNSALQQWMMNASGAAVTAASLPRRKKKRRDQQWTGRRGAANDNGERLAA